ncbi:hypothetical protein RhiXN_11447 [Rhizoctonia solani]|uniref:Uncharacterized protein n=1 Tax=Rhizoctonia solani TaxID=456999 RepID=A0A8H8P3I1_9AGAM|nr:uncharacterized protein RhiXN_11447 [Rhizoctonia solani]QRW24535.1 hypothetical protein RhiXN_11447 [Rhizoctonia solani]
MLHRWCAEVRAELPSGSWCDPGQRRTLRLAGVIALHRRPQVQTITRNRRLMPCHIAFNSSRTAQPADSAPSVPTTERSTACNPRTREQEIGKTRQSMHARVVYHPGTPPDNRPDCSIPDTTSGLPTALIRKWNAFTATPPKLIINRRLLVVPPTVISNISPNPYSICPMFAPTGKKMRNRHVPPPLSSATHQLTTALVYFDGEHTPVLSGRAQHAVELVNS